MIALPERVIGIGRNGRSASPEYAAYLLRDESGSVEVVHDRHVMGLFPRAVWLELIAAAGFEPLAVPFDHSSFSNTGHEVFLGLRPTCAEV